MQPLTPIQTQVLAGLLAGQPIAAVARENGIDRSTIYHWRKDHPHFTFALDQARARLQTALYDEVQDLVSQALEVLAELLHSENVNIRLRVAQTLLRIANPMKANTNLHTNIGVETLSDHAAGLHAIAAPAEASASASASAPAPATTSARASAPASPSPSGAGDRSRLPTSPPESSTIRHFSTLAKPSPVPPPRTPSRNQRCPCNSGIKYKKCCGSRPASQANPTAA